MLPVGCVDRLQFYKAVLEGIKPLNPEPNMIAPDPNSTDIDSSRNWEEIERDMSHAQDISEERSQRLDLSLVHNRIIKV